MTKPRGHINTPEKCRQAREHLGLTKAGLARVLRLSEVNGRDTVRRVEQGQEPSGPYQIALEALVAGFRPVRVKLPIDGKATSK